MTKAIAQTYNILNENLKIVNYVFLTGCFLIILLYVISIFSVVSKTVALQKIEAKISLLSSNVNNLDSEYLAFSLKISPDSLSDYGMSKGQVSEYITRSKIVSNHVALRNER